ncbi:MAG: antitoxin family protein [Armatimonadota bacterium]
MTLTVRARYDGRALIPEEPLNLPTGQTLEIEIRLPDTPPPDAHAAWEQLKATAVRGLNLPDDALRRENLCC